MGGWNSLDCLSAESFPTALRAAAMGFLSVFGRAASAASQEVFGALLPEDNGEGESIEPTVLQTALPLVIAGAVIISGAIATLFLPKEPKGKSLEAIEDTDERAKTRIAFLDDNENGVEQPARLGDAMAERSEIDCLMDSDELQSHM